MRVQDFDEVLRRAKVDSRVPAAPLEPSRLRSKTFTAQVVAPVATDVLVAGTVVVLVEVETVVEEVVVVCDADDGEWEHDDSARAHDERPNETRVGRRAQGRTLRCLRS